MALLDIRELARELKVGRSTLYKLTKEGAVPAIRVGGQLRFDIIEVTHALAQSNGEKAKDHADL